MSAALPSGLFIQKPTGKWIDGVVTETLLPDGNHASYLKRDSLFVAISIISQHINSPHATHDCVLWRDGEYVGFFPVRRTVTTGTIGISTVSDGLTKKKEEVKSTPSPLRFGFASDPPAATKH
jgi:hypothetical protein